MQRRLFIVIAIVLAIIVLAGLGFFVLNQQGGEEAADDTAPPVGALPEEQEIPMVSAIVARQPIGRGSEFVPGSLGRTEFPEGTVPPEAIVSESETIGKIAKVAIEQGQIILRGYLQDKALGTASEAAFQIPDGHVMVPFPIDRQSGVAYALAEGDFVDVLMTVSFVDMDPEFQTILPNKFSFIIEEPFLLDGEIAGTTITIDPDAATDEGRLAIENENFPGFEFPSEKQRPRRVAQLTVQGAKVIKVGSWIPEPTPVPVEGEAPPPPALPDIVSLAVVPQDALVLLWARQTQARMELALRAAGDEGNHSTEAVTLQYMLTRFNIAVPPKLEFGIDKSEDVGPTPTPTLVQPSGA